MVYIHTVTEMVVRNTEIIQNQSRVDPWFPRLEILYT